MRDTLIIGAAILVAIALGAWLMFGDTASAPESVVPVTEGPVAFSVLEEGTQASPEAERKNYRIRTQEELEELWPMVEEGAAPTVDFTKSEVLAAFDGTRPSGGYGIRVASIDDMANARRIIIVHTSPGEGCITTDALTSPFTIVVVPKTELAISRVDQENVVECN